jgi:AraC-like DNA-binding protein
MDRPMTTHAHREGHLLFHVEGAPAGLRVDDVHHPVTPRRAVAVSPWEPHAFEPDPDESASLLLILYIKPLWFLETSRSAQFALRFGRNGIEMDDTLRHLVVRVTGLLLDAEASDLFDGYLFELTRAAFDQSWQWSPGAPTLAETAAGFSDFRVRKSLRILQERFVEPVELTDIARAAGLSRPHFFKLFKKQMGVTPNLYLNTLRMEAAIEDLTESRRTITDIGYRLGFASQASFTRFFAANVGIPPTDYRRVASLVMH